MAIASEPSPERVSAQLRQWLRVRFDCDVVDVATPGRIGGGLDFWIYSLHVGAAGLPPEWSKPLVARMPPTPDRFTSLERESRLQSWNADLGYPAPRVLQVLKPGELFASPVQIMQRMPGGTMTAMMTARPWRIPGLVGRLAALHARLHALSVPDWATGPDWSLANRRLGLVRYVLEHVDHAELASGLESVEQLVPLLDVDPVMCHGDFHPMNLLVDGRDTAVIDWTDAGVGDCHGDIARTAWLFHAAAVAAPRRAERVVLRSVAPLLARRYLASYRRHRAIDTDRLRLWMPLHILHAWAMAVADEMELVGPSRAGTDFRGGLSTWAREQFMLSTRALR